MLRYNARMGKNTGKIIIAQSANVWPHELETAKALSNAGYSVEFVKKSEIDGQTTADVIINGVAWEMKSPESNSMRAVQRNIHKALRQSRFVVIDSRRMRGIPGEAIEREVRSLAPKFKSLRRLLFVNRRGEVLDIK